MNIAQSTFDINSNSDPCTIKSIFNGLSTLAFNALRLIGQTSLKVMQVNNTKRSKRKRLRIRTVLLNLMYVGAIICTHAHKQTLKFGRNCYQYPIIEYLNQKLH